MQIMVRDIYWLLARVRFNLATGCWEWTRSRTDQGYGRFGGTIGGIRSQRGTPHRLALEIKLGRPIRPGMQTLHACDNPPCCNPNHLSEGTNYDNIRDRMAKGRMRHPVGEQNPKARLKAAQIPAIRDLLSDGATVDQVAERYGVSHSAIAHIKYNRHWTHV